MKKRLHRKRREQKPIMQISSSSQLDFTKDRERSNLTYIQLMTHISHKKPRQIYRSF